MRHCTKRN